MSSNHLADRYTCSWPWTIAVMLSDGRIVCGCADPYAKRVLGDARAQPLTAIWTGETIRTLRHELNSGQSAFCGDCPLKRPLAADLAPPERPLDAGLLPSRLYVECTAACNISCFQACCAPETGITRTRQAGMLDFDLFARVIDEAGPALGRIDFFNYGEAFLHTRAIDMCAHIKTRFPDVYLYTSTNGLAFRGDAARRLVRTGIDEVTFSIDGASQESYARYRQRGQFDIAMTAMREMADEKRQAGRDVPVINWRYILFTWNDSDEEMERARALAAEIGVDRLTWEITDHPEEAFSRRFRPGSPDYERIRYEVWDTNDLGNAIPGAMPRAAIEPVGTWPFVGFLGRRGRQLRVQTRVTNRSTRPYPRQASHGRRLVRLGAQLSGADGTLIDRDHARAWLPTDLLPGATIQVPIDIPMPADAGRYRLKFDLVSEGVDWFESCGSPVTITPLCVV